MSAEPTGAKLFDGWPFVRLNDSLGEPTWAVGIELKHGHRRVRRHALLIHDEYLNISIATRGPAAIAIASVLVTFSVDGEEPRAIRLGGQVTLLTRLGSKLVALHDLGVDVISSGGEAQSILIGTVTHWVLSDTYLHVKGDLGQVRVEV